MKRGRKPTTGKFETRGEFVSAVLSRANRGQTTRQIARYVGACHKTVHNVLRGAN